MCCSTLFGRLSLELIIIMKEKEKINWSIITFIFVFCACLRLGMSLDLNKHTYPNNLNAYQETIIGHGSTCGNELFLPYNNMNDSITILR